MCLAIPMMITEIGPNASGISVLEGVSYQVDLSLIEDPKVGDYVIVHAGFAIEKLDESEAEERIRLFREISEKA